MSQAFILTLVKFLLIFDNLKYYRFSLDKSMNTNTTDVLEEIIYLKKYDVAQYRLIVRIAKGFALKQVQSMNIGYYFIQVFVLKLLILESLQQKLENDYVRLNHTNELTNTMMSIFEKCLKNESARNVVIARDDTILIETISRLVPIQFYTFNPFTDFAPKLWRETVSDYGKGKNPWTLFKTSSLNFSHPRICENLIFDKTRILKGYAINMGAYVHSFLLEYNPNKTGLDRFGGVNGDITRTVCNHLNATANVKFYLSMGFIDDHGMYQSFLKDLHHGDLDFAMNMNLMRRMWKKQTYPHETSGFCMVSLKDPVTFLEKITLVFPAQTWVWLVIIFIVLIFALKILLKQSLFLAGFEFLRMFLNTPISRLSPQDSGRRLFYLVIVVMTMIINAIFQTRLSSINVSTRSHRYIDTMSDLIKSNFFIYGTLSYKELFSDQTVLRHRYQLSEYPDCINRLKRNEQVICLPGCIEARFGAYEGNEFHISSKELMLFSMVFSTREDWPLLSRFNEILRKMSEAGLISLFRRIEARHFKHNPDDRQRVPKISVESLAFGFVLLLSGLSLGIVCLIIEIVTIFAKKYSLKKSLFNKVFMK
ncbi:uncharacterized protein LOC103316297 [Nasonia vitripennis]|uniref:Uncharacterized protein n=1 Tax=Nasonia vitripennis TaxID=7425 RepID=A0A7M7QKX4_NASVI|nr:uncharacterized protein LOC103316297 [Nasonia vitripennis]